MIINKIELGGKMLKYMKEMDVRYNKGKRVKNSHMSAPSHYALRCEKDKQFDLVSHWVTAPML